MRTFTLALFLSALAVGVSGCGGARGQDGARTDGAVAGAGVEVAASQTASAAAAGASLASESFPAWLERLRPEARARGVSDATFDAAFRGVRVNQQVLDNIQSQPEFVRPVWDYLDNAISEQRVQRGRALLAEHRTALRRVEERYGVPAEIIVAIWGLESNFGSFMGTYNVVEALASLAYAGHRREAFREFLLDALVLLERGKAPPGGLTGSWAGAVGHTQFMPSAYLRYAVDGDGDGRRDLWNSLPDVFASTANYLVEHGWRSGEPWGYEVTVPADFDWSAAEITQRLTVADWQARGVRRIDGGRLGPESREASVMVLAGHRGPVFIVFDNFRAILRYNNATSYALAVGHLADRLGGAGGFQASWPRGDRPLTRSERAELQELLGRGGYEPGPVDGMVGPMTRTALRRFQQDQGAVPDGYASTDVLFRLRRHAP